MQHQHLYPPVSLHRFMSAGLLKQGLVNSAAAAHLLITTQTPIQTPIQTRRVFPNCTAKEKGGRAVYVGDALNEARDIMALVLRRPFDRVRGAARAGHRSAGLVRGLAACACSKDAN